MMQPTNSTFRWALKNLKYSQPYGTSGIHVRFILCPYEKAIPVVLSQAGRILPFLLPTFTPCYLHSLLPSLLASFTPRSLYSLQPSLFAAFTPRSLHSPKFLLPAAFTPYSFHSPQPSLSSRHLLFLPQYSRTSSCMALVQATYSSPLSYAL